MVVSYDEILNHIDKGQIEEASALVEKFVSQDKLKGLMFKSICFLYRDQYQNAIQLASEVIQHSREIKDPIAALGALWCKLFSLQITNNFRQFRKTVRETEDLLELSKNGEYNLYHAQEWISLIYCVQAGKEMYVGNYEKSIKIAEKALAIGTKLKSPRVICGSLWILNIIYQQDKEQADIALEYANQLLEVSKQHNLDLSIACAYHSLIFCYRLLGDLDNSLKYADLGIPLSKKIGWMWLTNLMIGELGHQYAARGDYDQALQQFWHVFNVAQQAKDHWQMAMRMINIGHIFRVKGELNSALTAFQNLHTASSKIGNRFFQSYASHAIGTIYYDQGAYKDALKMFQESLHIRKGFRNKSHLSKTLFSLILLAIELNKLDDAEAYFSQLESIRTTAPDNKHIQTNYEFAKALLLKISPRMKNKVKAQEIFENIANDKRNSHSAITSALLNLCDLLVYEYKSAEEPEILDEINSLSQRLYSISQEKNDYRTTIKALILRGKISLLEGDLNKVEQLLEEAHQITVDVGLGSLLNQVSQEQEQIKAEVEKWKLLLDRNVSVRERIEEAALEDYIRSALRIMEDEVI